MPLPLRVTKTVLAVLVASPLLASPLFAQTTPSVSELAAPSSVADQTPIGALGGRSLPDAWNAAQHETRDVLPSFGSLFTNLGRDLRRLPSRETGLILGIAGALSAGVHEQDRRITRSAAASPALDTVFAPGAVLGGGYVQIGAAFATYAVGRALHSPRVSVVGGDLVRAQLMTAAITQGLKFSVGRTRPDGTRFSFPSGHTSATFATATVLQRHFGWKVGAPAYVFAAYIGGSRLQENRHYLSDVLFGAAVGVVAGRTATIGSGRARFAMSPTLAPGGGGAGVGFTWLPQR